MMKMRKKDSNPKKMYVMGAREGPRGIKGRIWMKMMSMMEMKRGITDKNKQGGMRATYIR